MSRSGWRGWYGNEDAIDPQTFLEWRDAERARMREVMRARRARLRETRLAQGPRTEPAYPEPVLEFMERWVEAHGKRDAELDLAEIVHHIRKNAFTQLGEVSDCIQDRGVAKYLRSLGFKLRRAAAGMVVEGLWIK